MMHRLTVPALLAVLGLTMSACGSQSIGLAESHPNYAGAVLFKQNCAGCHTLSKAGTEGSAVSIGDREKVDGPNFDQRAETKAQVLYAIRNGGFSGAVMPPNIVTGDDADAVARFLAEYAGKKAKGK